MGDLFYLYRNLYASFVNILHYTWTEAPLMCGNMRLVFKLVNELGYLKQLIAVLLQCV
jgi:hypothetical protein